MASAASSPETCCCSTVGRKSVRFFPQVFVREILQAAKSVEECWYTDQKYRQMQAKTVYWIRRLQRGDDEEEEQCCARGLERMYGNGLARRIVRRSLLYKSFAAAQEQHHKQAVQDPYAWEALADLSRRISQPSVLEAYERGLEDARVAAQACMAKKKKRKHFVPLLASIPIPEGAMRSPLRIVVDRAPGRI